jgi:hypothetical protein
MPGKKNYLKEKVQVQYKTTSSFEEDDKAIKPYADDAERLIGEIKKAEWTFEFQLKIDKKKGTAEVDRIKAIGYPQIRNGHQGESGHDWQWQLDTESMGKGSKVRLYLDKAAAKITKQKTGSTVKVGTEEFQVVECDVKVTGKFTAGQKH